MTKRRQRPAPQPAQRDPDTGTLTEIKTTIELCQLLSLTSARISQLQTAGVIAPDATGRWDIFKVVPAYAAWLRNRKGERSNAGSVNDSDRRLAKAKADMAEQKRDLLAGKVLPVDAVTRLWAGILSKVRGQLLVLPTKIAPLVAVERETEACRLVIEQHVHEALRELSDAAAAERIADTAVGSGSGDDGDEPIEAATETDGEPVGGPESALEFGGEFGAGALDDFTS